jgi:hypothetical protein
MARDQSMRPWLHGTARWIPGPGPCLPHWAKRRGVVWNGTPNEGGRSRHAHPLVSTYTIAVNAWRSASGGVPPALREVRLDEFPQVNQLSPDKKRS